MQFDRASDLLVWSLEQDLGDEDLNRTLRKYYDSFFGTFGPLRRRKYDLQLEALTADVRTGRVKTVLDVGCGCGTVSLWLASQGADVLGVDLKDDRLRVARRRAELLGVPARFATESLFEITGKFDTVWLEQAFHHVEPREQAYGHIAGLLNPGGQVVISESNAWNPVNQAFLFKVRGFKTIKRKVDADGREHLYGDERITTPGALTSGFGRHGIKPVSHRYYGVLPNSRLSERMAGLERVVPPFMIPAFTHYLWVGEKV